MFVKSLLVMKSTSSSIDHHASQKAIVKTMRKAKESLKGEEVNLDYNESGYIINQFAPQASLGCGAEAGGEEENCVGKEETICKRWRRRT